MNRTRLPNGLEIFENNPAETAATYAEIWEHRMYQQHGLTIGEGDCIFDIGAHIGLATLFFHTLNLRVRVYAFEPSPTTFDVLKANVKLHGIDAKLFNLALANTSGEGRYTFYHECPSMSGLYGDPEEERMLAMKYLTNKGIDVTGAEFLLRSKFVGMPMLVRL